MMGMRTKVGNVAGRKYTKNLDDVISFNLLIFAISKRCTVLGDLAKDNAKAM